MYFSPLWKLGIWDQGANMVRWSSSWVTAFLSYVHMVDGTRMLSRVSLIRTLISCMRSPHPCSDHIPNALPSNIFAMGIRIPNRNCERHKCSSHSIAHWGKVLTLKSERRISNRTPPLVWPWGPRASVSSFINMYEDTHIAEYFYRWDEISDVIPSLSLPHTHIYTPLLTKLWEGRDFS